jgi:hypothetical protein
LHAEELSGMFQGKIIAAVFPPRFVDAESVLGGARP